MNDAKVREIIETKNQALEEWYAEGEVDKVAETFAQDVWQMPPDSPPLVGREALREFWSQAVEAGDWKFSLRTQEVIVNDPITVERGKYELEFTTGPDASPDMHSFEDRGNYVVVWRRDEDGEWRILWDAPVSELPASGATDVA